jgi:hypothetical protein
VEISRPTNFVVWRWARDSVIVQMLGSSEWDVS